MKMEEIFTVLMKSEKSVSLKSDSIYMVCSTNFVAADIEK